MLYSGIFINSGFSIFDSTAIKMLPKLGQQKPKDIKKFLLVCEMELPTLLKF